MDLTSPAPKPSQARQFQARVPNALAQKCRWLAHKHRVTNVDVVRAAILRGLPIIEAYEEGAVCSPVDPANSTALLVRIEADVVRRVMVEVNRATKWNRTRTELVPGGSRDAVITLCLAKALQDVVPDGADPAQPAEQPSHGRTRQALIPVPPQLHDWLHTRNPRGVSAFVRQALEVQLPQIEADPGIKRGSAAQPRGAKWPTLSARIQSRAWDEAERIAVVKHMPRVQVLRAAVVRAVVEAARQEEALRRAERERQEIISRGVFATQPAPQPAEIDS